MQARKPRKQVLPTSHAWATWLEESWTRLFQPHKKVISLILLAVHNTEALLALPAPLAFSAQKQPYALAFTLARPLHTLLNLLPTHITPLLTPVHPLHTLLTSSS